MSRKKIERHVAEAGWTLDYLDWEPLGIVMEKSGQEGGWIGEASKDDRTVQIMGYNWQQAIAWFDIEVNERWTEDDPFSCARKPGYKVRPGECMGYLGHKGDHSPKPAPVRR